MSKPVRVYKYRSSCVALCVAMSLQNESLRAERIKHRRALLSKNLGLNVGRILHFQLRTRKLCRVTGGLINPPRVCAICNTPEVYLPYLRLIKYGRRREYESILLFGCSESKR